MGLYHKALQSDINLFSCDFKYQLCCICIFNAWFSLSSAYWGESQED